VSVRGYSRGEVLFEQGDPADSFFFVALGLVKVARAGPSGREVILDLFRPGDAVGALAVFDQRVYPATATALEPSSVVRVPAREFFALVEKHPEMVRGLLKGMVTRTLELARRIADQTESVEVRAARLFLTLAERAGSPQGNALVLRMDLSRRDLAELIGTTVESTIRLMSRWQRDGTVLTEKGRFVVPDASVLKRIADHEQGRTGPASG
jgi:CRP-like cAMP-binding protein